MSRRLPPWFRQEIPDRAVIAGQRALAAQGVITVCKQARCPNFGECFKRGEFTFMILGDTCTRGCRFCAVNKGDPQGAFSGDEPGRIAATVAAYRLAYVVITSVNRDDLSDGGAAAFAEVVRAVRGVNPRVGIELLIPDFRAAFSSIEVVVRSRPSVIGHNLEVVRRLHAQLKPQCSYEDSLEVLRKIKLRDPQIITKTSLMVGLGETKKEVRQALDDARGCGCESITIGQYLAPSASHTPVREFIAPGIFKDYADLAYSLGFKAVASGPLVRSSYKAARLWEEVINSKVIPCMT